MGRDPASRMARAAERTAKATETAARNLRRTGKAALGQPAGAKTAGDLLSETADTLGRAVGMTPAEMDGLADALVAAWREHFERHAGA